MSVCHSTIKHHQGALLDTVVIACDPGLLWIRYIIIISVSVVHVFRSGQLLFETDRKLPFTLIVLLNFSKIKAVYINYAGIILLVVYGCYHLIFSVGS